MIGRLLGSTTGRQLCLACVSLCFLSPSLAEDTSEDLPPLTLSTVEPPPPISPEEPLAGSYSLKRAVRYLDQVALSWQKERKCGTCHTNFAYLMTRPAAAAVSPPASEVRSFFEDMVKVRWETKGPRWPAEVVVAATTLAFNDRWSTGKLHPLTRTALDRMATLQREDGSWDWLKCGWPPMESDDHYGVTFAAMGIGAAPEEYAKTPAAKKMLEGIRKYLKNRPPLSLHHRAMVLWASLLVDGLMTADDRKKILERLLALQRPEGGWAIASLFEDWEAHERKDDEPQDLNTGDGYATGFVIYLARQMEIASGDPRLQRGVRWLKANQRQSGRWFTRSPTKDSKHFISNIGTAYAVLALTSCGETALSPSPSPSQPR